MKTNMQRGAALALLFTLGAMQGQPAWAQQPEVHWEMATWAPEKPDGTPLAQATSGEDWAYDVEVSYSAGSPDGYIYTGYSTFPGYQFPSGYGMPCGNLTKGCSMPKLFKTDLEGNLLWYRSYSNNEGELTAVIQTSDGGYLAVGRSREWGSRLTYYGKTSSTSSLSCSSNCPRNIYVVKTNAAGVVQWERLYGLADNPNGSLSLLKRDAEAWDVVEMPGGNFRITGQVLDSDDAARDSQGGYITKAFLLEINASGVRQWIKAYGDTGKASIARGLARSGNDYTMVLNQFNQPEYLSTSAYADIWVYKVGSTSNPSPIFKTQLTSSTSQHDFGYDVIYNTAGQILAAGVINCFNPDGGCFRDDGARGEGTARVYRLSSGGTVLGSTSSALGTVKAFDLWVTLAPTSDGGSILVSTKQLSSRTDFFFTDAYVAKLSQSLAVEWDLTYDAETSKPHNVDGDKHQECLYGVVPAPSGGYTISGNNSSNYDDDYVVKFKAASSQTVDYTTVDHEYIYYWGPDDLTIGPSFTIQSTSYVELVARNSILITGPFEAKLGSEFEAVIDPYFSGVQSKMASPPAWDPTTAGETEVQGDAGGTRAGAAFGLEPNYPNPFNPSTEIRFALPEAAHVTLVVYDVTGREVMRLVDGALEAGRHQVRWDASSLPSGVYLYQLRAGSFTKTQRMTLVK